MVNVNHIHALENLPCLGFVAKGEKIACASQGQARAANDAGFVILILKIAKSEDVDLMPCGFEGAFVQVNVIGDAADVRLVGVCHHADTHGDMLRQGEEGVKEQGVKSL